MYIQSIFQLPLYKCCHKIAINEVISSSHNYDFVITIISISLSSQVQPKPIPYLTDAKEQNFYRPTMEKQIIIIKDFKQRKSEGK